MYSGHYAPSYYANNIKQFNLCKMIGYDHNSSTQSMKGINYAYWQHDAPAISCILLPVANRSSPQYKTSHIS